MQLIPGRLAESEHYRVSWNFSTGNRSASGSSYFHLWVSPLVVHVECWLLVEEGFLLSLSFPSVKIRRWCFSGFPLSYSLYRACLYALANSQGKYLRSHFKSRFAFIQQYSSNFLRLSDGSGLSFMDCSTPSGFIFYTKPTYLWVNANQINLFLKVYESLIKKYQPSFGLGA